MGPFGAVAIVSLIGQDEATIRHFQFPFQAWNRRECLMTEEAVFCEGSG